MLQNNHFAISLDPFYKLRYSIIFIRPLKVIEIGSGRLTPGSRERVHKVVFNSLIDVYNEINFYMPIR